MATASLTVCRVIGSLCRGAALGAGDRKVDTELRFTFLLVESDGLSKEELRGEVDDELA